MSQVTVSTEKQGLQMVLVGVARDAHASYPITFAYSDSGSAYFNGCKVEATIDLNNGQQITKKIDVRAFGEVAEQLAHLQDGMPVVFVGDFGQQQNKKDSKWYDIVTITEVISA